MHGTVPAPDGGERAARLRIALTYWWRHGRWPDLRAPQLFTELVQQRKLRDRDPRLPLLADKVAVKPIVAARLGPEWVIPTLWSGTQLPARPPRSQPVVVKSRHGCNQTAIVRDAAAQWDAVRRAAAGWMRRRYGWWLDEWLYARIPRGLLIEPLIGNGRDLPVDYKVYVFAGQASHVQVHLDRGGDHRWVMHDRDWRALANAAPAVPRPSALPAMIAAAEALGAEFEFVRVDFYQPGDQPLFGEFSFYPGSGLDRFDPPGLDAQLGRLWRRECPDAAGRRASAGGRP